MISATAYRLRCDDVRCIETVEFNMQGSESVLTIEQIRARVEHSGWRYYDGRDFCPPHAEGYMSAPYWNSLHETGTPVRFWPGAKAGEGRVSTTRTRAFTTKSGTPVVFMTDFSSYVALSHVTPIPKEEAL